MKTLRWFGMLAMIPLMWACSSTDEELEITVPTGCKDCILNDMSFDNGVEGKTLSVSQTQQDAIETEASREGVLAFVNRNDLGQNEAVTIMQAEQEMPVVLNSTYAYVEIGRKSVSECNALVERNNLSHAHDMSSATAGGVIDVANGSVNHAALVTKAQAEYKCESGGGCPDEHHPHAIDLGLPSGTKWACCNVGASRPGEYGGYYAWGETDEKSVYDKSTYLHYQDGGYVNIGSDIVGTQYDVAHVRIGGSWRMPTKEQMQELMDNCTQIWGQYDGVYGYLVTGPNGNQIFFPPTGYRLGKDGTFEGSNGDYWSGTLNPGFDYAAYLLYIGSGHWYWAGDNRENGRPVRAVCP